jgi:hypothetical protein
VEIGRCLPLNQRAAGDHIVADRKATNVGGHAETLEEARHR